ncbi:MAG TPA: DUF2779 domain-containing protein [Gammaproteobacteria bacterium]
MHFTKTSILAGLQCHKHLHLSVHHPERASRVVSPMMITGEVVEQHARREFGDAVSVARHGATDPVAMTQSLIADRNIKVIFQAALRHAAVEVLVDVLQRAGAGWNLVEIKAASGIKDYHIDDVAIQAWVALNAGLTMQSFKLMHINADFAYPGQHDYAGLFLMEDVSERVLAHLPFIESQLELFRHVVAGPQPDIHLGSYCKHPHPCEFKTYCESVDAAYPVSILPHGQKLISQLIAQGIYDVRDIPVEILRSEIHLKVRNITRAGKAELDSQAANILKRLDYPRYFLDFECIQFAIPVWAGTQSYQQIPFQFSCHCESAQGELSHREFLDVSGREPRRQFAEALITACGERGPVIVYNQAFEKRVIKELAHRFPDLSGALLAINARVFDLLPVVKQHYYHPAMQGSWSIKKVLPCLVPELAYDALGEVQDGIEAQQAFLRIYNGDLTAQQRDQLVADLRAYCALDTLAMVKIAQRLQSA